jgi:2-polyprenyl-3-methyl-5-hydroxy-6-metoxy-1,4-benzoquinol methylase
LSTTSVRPIDLALQMYADQSLGIRAFVRARHLLCPLSAIERYVPARGRILDLGCGHGLFSALMAIASPERAITGIEPSAVKMQTASTLISKLPNVQFRQGTIADVSDGSLDAITILDVLYLLPVPEKLKILKRCRDLLGPDGRLVLKTNDTHPAWKYRWAWLQEVAMTRIGLTMGEEALYFISCTETVGLLREAGFSRIEVVHLPYLLPYPHTLFSCLP